MKKRFHWDVAYLYWGITAFCVIVCGVTFFLILNNWQEMRVLVRQILGILSPIIYGLIFAYLLGKVMSFFERRVFSRLINRIFKKRSEKNRFRAVRILSLLLTVVLAILIIGGVFILVLPQILRSLQALLFALPGYYNTAVKWLTNTLEDHSLLEDAAVGLTGAAATQLTNWIENSLLTQANRILANILGGAVSVLRTAANFLIGLVISIYMMYNKEKLSAQAKKVVYSVFGTGRANKLVIGAEFLDKTFGSFIFSRLIDALIIGSICYIFMLAFNMPYPTLIAVIVGLTNIIPFFGPFIGGIPSGVLILLVNPMKCLIFVIFIVILQQLDGNLIYPKIQGSSLGLSGFWVICALLLFSGLFGFWGMLLGVPVFAAIYIACKNAVNKSLKSRGMPSDTEEFKKIYIFDEKTNEPVGKREGRR